MSHRKLKNFERYKDKVLLYAEALHITMEFREYAQDGVWYPSKNKIVIDPDMTNTEELATILHELGHATDDVLMEPSRARTKLEVAYGAVYAKTHNQAQLDLVVGCEKQAWSNGRKIATQMKIKLGKWYDEEEKIAIRDYKKD